MRAPSCRPTAAIVAEVGAMPGLGEVFHAAGPRRVRKRVAEVLGERGPPQEARRRAATFVNLVLGDLYLELTLGLAPTDFEARLDEQVDLAVRVTLHGW